MKTATITLQMLVRITGLAQIVLGIVLWTGSAQGLRNLHIVVGFALVLSLLGLVALAAAAHVGPGLVTAAALLVLVVPILGMTQTGLLLGGLHWLIQVLHLIIGLAAIAIAERLAAEIEGTPMPASQP
jgi:hypothetical protein